MVRVLASLSLFFGLMPAFAQIGASPPLVTIDVESSRTESVRLFNYGSEPVEVEVEVRDWTLDELNAIAHREPTEQSLSSWLVINPLRFSVAAGRSQVVRFSARPRVRPEAGEHRAMIYFNQVQPFDGPPLQVRFQLGVAVYGTVGDVVRRGTLEHANVVDRSLVYRVASEGTGHVRVIGGFHVEHALDSRTVLEGTFPTTPVLPGTRRTFRVPLSSELEAGDYVLTLDASVGDRPVTKRIAFRVEDRDRAADTARR